MRTRLHHWLVAIRWDKIPEPKSYIPLLVLDDDEGVDEEEDVEVEALHVVAAPAVLTMLKWPLLKRLLVV